MVGIKKVLRYISQVYPIAIILLSEAEHDINKLQ